MFQQIVIPRIDLVKPTASLTRLADGRANWTFDFGPKDESAEPSKWQLDIGAIGFDQGKVSFDDQTLKTSMKVQIDRWASRSRSAISSARPARKRPAALRTMPRAQGQGPLQGPAGYWYR